MPNNQLKEYTFVVDGKSFRIMNDAADSLLAGSLGQNNTWEPWQLELYSKIVKSDSICFDIGGNIGTSAVAMSRYAQSGHVYTFEPVKQTFEILSTNIEINNIGNVTPTNIGISNEVGEAIIRVDRSLLGNAHRVIGESQPSDDLHYDETFRMQPIDGWMEQHGVDHVDVIKVDVEGFELEVIEGGKKAFFGSDTTVAIFEFGIQPQRDARPQRLPEPPRDISFFLKLKSAFKHIFLIGRDAKLYPVHDYAHLRCLMMAGYPVEDLMCCQIVPSAVQDMIALGFKTASQIPVLALAPAGSSGIAIAYNRGEDGWTYPSPDAPGTRSGLIFSLSKPTSVRLELPAVHSHASGLQSHSILLTVGDRDYNFDVLDRSGSIALHLPIGVTYVFVETDYAIQANSYFGNPGDNRNIGVRINLPDFETVM